MRLMYCDHACVGGFSHCLTGRAQDGCDLGWVVAVVIYDRHAPQHVSNFGKAPVDAAKGCQRVADLRRLHAQMARHGHSSQCV